VHQETQSVRHELSEVMLAKEELERLTEQLIKKVVMGSGGNADQMMSMSDSSASFAGGFTIESRPLKENVKRTTGEVLKTTARDMREMTEVLRELGNLIGQVLSDKRTITQ
jgi:hypothetical protein